MTEKTTKKLVNLLALMLRNKEKYSEMDFKYVYKLLDVPEADNPEEPVITYLNELYQRVK